MPYTVQVKQHVPVKYLRAEMGVRYWEDGKVNGVEDDDGNPKMPMVFGNTWQITIDLETGRIFDWPEGVTAETHYKVCDAGVYTLENSKGPVIQKDGYVPSMLCPKGNGYGDYVIMSINGDGVIEGFTVDLDYFEDDE